MVIAGHISLPGREQPGSQEYRRSCQRHISERVSCGRKEQMGRFLLHLLAAFLLLLSFFLSVPYPLPPPSSPAPPPFLISFWSLTFPVPTYATHLH